MGRGDAIVEAIAEENVLRVVSTPGGWLRGASDSVRYARPVMEVKRVQNAENIKDRIVIEKSREDQMRTVTFAVGQSEGC